MVFLSAVPPQTLVALSHDHNGQSLFQSEKEDSGLRYRTGDASSQLRSQYSRFSSWGQHKSNSSGSKKWSGGIWSAGESGPLGLGTVGLGAGGGCKGPIQACLRVRKCPCVYGP